MANPIQHRPVVAPITSPATQPVAAPQTQPNTTSPSIAQGPLSEQFRSTPRGLAGVFGTRVQATVTAAKLCPEANMICDRAAEYIPPQQPPADVELATIHALKIVRGGLA